jgi:DNA-binding CsgD family transcriptional regulator
MQITEDRKKRIIDLYFNQHKSYAEIAEIEHISPRDIHAIIKEEQARRQKYKQQEISAQAYKLFSEGKTPVEVAIILNLREPEATKLYRAYCKLRGLDKLNLIYKETNGKLVPFLKLYKELIKRRGMNIEQVANAVDIAANKLPYMESLYGQVKEQVDNTQRTIEHLSNDMHALEYKISILDRIAFSIEQDSRGKHQEIQELIAQKNRLEKWIAKVSNNDELKQMINENVKAALSDKNK